jgi:hypothetical protein
MAYVEGYPGEKSKHSAEKHIAFIVIVIIMISGIMLFYAKDWRAELPTIAVTVTIISAIIFFVSYKMYPVGWRRLLKGADYEEMIRLDRMIADSLRELDDNYYIFHDITFELFQVQHLIISIHGIVVVSKIAKTDKLHVREKVLFSGNYSLDTETGNLWRICHLINIVIRKGFNVEIMPRPIMVVPEAQTVAVREYDGITIVPLEGLNKAIETEKNEVISLDLAQSFAYYIKKRYS